MPIKEGRIVVEVTCNCGQSNVILSGTYGVYCSACGSSIYTKDHMDDMNEEIRKVVKTEKLNIRKGKKNGDFLKEEFSVGSSPILSSCSNCGGPLTPESLFVVDGVVVCKSCYSNLKRCKACGEPHLPKNLKGNLCEGCRVSFVECPSCGQSYDIRKHQKVIIGEKEYCHECVTGYLDSKHVKYQSYGYKPAPLFLGNADVGYFFGVELEMDNSSKRNEFMALSHCKEIYYKSDGSLVNGVEVVSHPATLEYHMTEFPWKKILDDAKECGFRSHTGTSGDKFSNHPTCGLHIHVSKTAFGKTTSERDTREAKLLVLFDKFWSELVIFSRRDKASLDRWARKHCSFDITKDQLDKIIGKAKEENAGNRRLAVNMSGTSGSSQSTIEFRLFRGTLNYETLIATIQLIDLFVEATRLPTSEVQSLTWEAFCDNGCSKYTEFAGYISRLRSMKKKI